MTSSEGVLLEMPNVKYKKDDGRLYVMSERLAWIQGNRDVVTVSHKYADIKSQKISPEGKPKIQLQIVLHDNTSFTFHFVNPEGQHAQFRDRDQVKELLLQLLPKFRRKVNRELEEKNKLLNENPKLLQLYKDLVTDNIISSDEFWMTHAQQFLTAQKPSIPQDTGVSSGFLSGIHPETDGANGLRYNLTLDVIDSIFKTYPAVRRKHVECVPAQMTESLFWTKFFQSHYFHRDRLPVLKDLFSDCAKADEKEMRREIEKVKIYSSDVISVLEDSERGDAILKDGFDTSKDPKDKDSVTPQGIYRNMIKRFNHHSIMVLKACERPENQTNPANPPPPNSVPPPVPVQAPTPTTTITTGTGATAGENNNEPPPTKKKKKDKKDRDNGILENGELEALIIPPEVRKAQLAKKVVYEDLKSDGFTKFTKLNLTRVDRYLNGPIPDHKTDLVSSEQIGQAAQLMRECVPQWIGKPRLLDSAMAVKILGELRPGGALMKGSHLEHATQMLPPDTETEIRNLYASLSELLRHFWSCFPPTTSALEEKAHKIHETLKKFEQVKIQLVKDKLLRDHLSSAPLLAHAISMLAAADQKYNQWVQRNNRR